MSRREPDDPQHTSQCLADDVTRDLKRHPFAG